MEPIAVRILRLLKKKGSSLKFEEIVERLKEDGSMVERALKGLYEKNIVKKEGETFRYVASRRNESLVKKLLEVYDRVEKRPKIEKIVRGLLAPEAPFYFRDPFFSPYFLFHLSSFIKILKEEGFYKEEIKAFFEDEMNRGWMGRFEFYFGSKERISWPAPLIIHPQQFINHIRFNSFSKDRELIVIYIGKRTPFALGKNMSGEEFKKFKDQFLEKWRELGWFIRKEEYVIGLYPRHIARNAKEYLNREKRELKERIFGERPTYPF